MAVEQSDDYKNKLVGRVMLELDVIKKDDEETVLEALDAQLRFLREDLVKDIRKIKSE